MLDDGPCRYGQPSSVVRVDQHDFEILRAGVVTEKTLRRLASTQILLVCTGNTCRSPMAELLMKQAPHIPLRKRGEIEIKGKGLMSTYFVGRRASVKA